MCSCIIGIHTTVVGLEPEVDLRNGYDFSLSSCSYDRIVGLSAISPFLYNIGTQVGPDSIYGAITFVDIG
jgi:hypothetical protein